MGPLTRDDEPVFEAAPPAGRPVLEILDRDGQVRQTHTVQRWPLQVGRALDNDVVLSDPHVAAHHFSIEQTDTGLELCAAPSRNGVQLGPRHLHAGEHAALAAGGDTVELTAGRTRLRLRLPGHALAPELVLAPIAPLTRRIVPVLLAALVLVGGMLFSSYLATDPDGLSRAIGSTLMAAIVGAAVWCGAWALLSKTFTRQARFGWHVRVFLAASLALLALSALPALLAFAFSWPWLTDFAFVGEILVAATALYFHLLAVEPARHRMLKWAAATCAVVGVALTLWFNLQRGDRFGDELYMNHLFPPALRVARPMPSEAFITRLAPLKAVLDKLAKEPGRSDDAAGPGEED